MLRVGAVFPDGFTVELIRPFGGAHSKTSAGSNAPQNDLADRIRELVTIGFLNETTAKLAGPAVWARIIRLDCTADVAFTFNSKLLKHRLFERIVHHERAR